MKASRSRIVRGFVCATLVLLFSAMLLALLSGCEKKDDEVEPTNDELPGEEIIITETPPSPVSIADERFTLRFDSKSTLNPLTCKSGDNKLVGMLMYEGLFKINESFEAEPVLCESFSTQDNMTYTFKIKRGINMHDGLELTASDVAYSLTWAKNTSVYSQRLKAMESAVPSGEDTVTVVLARPDRNFIKLLDIPVIKYGSVDEKAPAGTGPYTFMEGGQPRLARFAGHADFIKLPANEIFLVECTDTEVVEMFSDSLIDILRDDPTDAVDISVSRPHETHYYNTTSLCYIGFSSANAALRDVDVRRAVSYAVDRSAVVGDILKREAIEAPLVLSPAYRLYDSAWVKKHDDTFAEMSALMSRAGLRDANNDTYLEYPISDGEYIPLSINFIVNKGNRFKVAIAQAVAAELRRIGLNITVSELDWDAFTAALEAGEFDMYIADTTLPANFDLTAILAAGGSLDYGWMGDEEYAELIGSFLGAETDAAEKEAARQICAMVSEKSTIIPVFYKLGAVLVGRNVISGMEPSQSNVFYNFSEWKIKLR